MFRRAVVRDEVDALAAYLISHSAAPVIVCIGSKLPDVLSETVRERARLVSLQGKTLRTRPAAALSAGTRSAGWRSRLKAGLASIGPLRALVLWRGIRRDIAAAEHVLRTSNAGAVLVFDDRSSRPEMAVLRAARRCNVRSVLVPFAASSVESDLFARRQRTDCMVDRGAGKLVKRALAYRYPNQVWRGENGRMLFFGLWETLVLAALKMAGTDAWAYGGGEVDAVALFGESDRNAAIALGLPATRLHVTGQASLDRLHRIRAERDDRRAALARAIGLNPNRPWVVCAVPHSAEHGLRSWDEHRRDTESLFAALARAEADVLLSLHPKSDPANYAPSAERHGLHIVADPLWSLLPLADIFVAGFSSTARWAALLGIPTIIADIAGIRYQMYDEFPAMPKLRDASELERRLRHWIDDPEARAAAGETLRSQARSLGIIDGGACQRIVGILDTLAAHRDGC